MHYTPKVLITYLGSGCVVKRYVVYMAVCYSSLCGFMATRITRVIDVGCRGAVVEIEGVGSFV